MTTDAQRCDPEHFRRGIRLHWWSYPQFGASQMVWGKLEQTVAKVAKVRARLPNLEKADEEILLLCERKVELARCALDRVIRHSYSFWTLIHQVDEMLLLVMPLDMLQSEAVDLLAKFKRKIVDRPTREAWLDTSCPSSLCNAVDRVVKTGSLRRAADRLAAKVLGGEDSKIEFRREREIMSGALHLLNEQGDVGFWRLGTNVMIQVLSAGLMMTLLGVAYYFFRCIFPWASDPDYPCQGQQEASGYLRASMVLLLGAAGAIVSNMSIDKSAVTSMGPTTRYFLYYLFAKPAVGAFTALLAFFLERSHMIFEFIVDSPCVKPQAAIRIFVGTFAAAEFARAAMSMVAGYAGDRLLTSMVGKTLDRLEKGAEKGTAKPLQKNKTPDASGEH